MYIIIRRFKMYPTIHIILLTTLMSNKCNGVIYNLNETMFELMPPLFDWDNYELCLENPAGLYCLVNFNLVSDEPSNLLHIIQEYSAHTPTHFNHTQLRHGICVIDAWNTSEKCYKHKGYKEADIESRLEKHLNMSLWNDYKLKTRITHTYCKASINNNTNGDIGDIMVAMLILSILIFNAVGSLYDIYWLDEKQNGNRYLLCFSIKSNWKKLTRYEEYSNSRLQKLRGLNGLKCIILCGVIIAHSIWLFHHITKNVHSLELDYKILPKYLFYNGPTIIQTYLVISGFLLVYKLQLYSEKHKVTWMMIPQGMLMRYLRITPAYAVVIALMSTLVKFLETGPLWEISTGLVMSHCRNSWWQNLLYFNNYVPNSQCMLHGWYVAVDIQLFCLGLLVCILLQSSRRRKIVLSLLFIIGIITPAAHTYFQDLDGLLIVAPGTVHNFFPTEPVFNSVYRAGHTNVASFVVGLALGYLVYKWEQQNYNIDKYQKYRFVYWSLLPLAVGVILSGSLFYRDAPRDPLYVRVLYAALAKPVFSILMAALILGMVFKIENVYRKFLERSIWVVLGRLSYSSYVVHLPLQRVYVALTTSLITATPLNILATQAFLIVGSFSLAVPLWLLVEVPFTELTKQIFVARDNTDNVRDEKQKNNTRL